MATVREGNKAVLLVIDVQSGVMSDAWDAPRVIANVARAVDRARGQDSRAPKDYAAAAYRMDYSLTHRG